MTNDVHYISIFIGFFVILGIISPLLNSEFNSDLNEDNTFELEESDYSTTTIVHIILNLILFPFWTFGLPAWVNLWFFSWIRLIFAFVIARNVWIGGGG